VIDGRKHQCKLLRSIACDSLMGVGEIRNFGCLLHVMVLEMESLFACPYYLVMAWEKERKGGHLDSDFLFWNGWNE
jgi:hypothetical protein